MTICKDRGPLPSLIPKTVADNAVQVSMAVKFQIIWNFIKLGLNQDQELQLH